MLFQLNIPGIGNIPAPSGFKFTGTSGDLASVINALLKYIYPFAGIIMFFLLIAGGFQLLTSTGNPESTKKAYQKILFAIIGFIFIFITFWLAQILQIILGVDIL